MESLLGDPVNLGVSPEAPPNEEEPTPLLLEDLKNGIINVEEIC